MAKTRKKTTEAGTSLIEVSLAILILVIIMGAVFSQIDNVTAQTKRESMSIDLVQQNRDFVDLFVRDIHMTGYPHTLLYGVTPSQVCGPHNIFSLPQCDKSVSTGIVYASPTSLRIEGDVYGDGNVYSVVYTYYCAASTAPCAGTVDDIVPPDPNCPCLRRSAMLKVNNDPINGQTQPKYYTEVQNVIDPSGMTQGIFTYFDGQGNSIGVVGGVDFEANGTTVQTIDAVKVNLNVRSIQLDVRTGVPVVYSLASVAELEN